MDFLRAIPKARARCAIDAQHLPRVPGAGEQAQTSARYCLSRAGHFALPSLVAQGTAYAPQTGMAESRKYLRRAEYLSSRLALFLLSRPVFARPALLVIP